MEYYVYLLSYKSIVFYVGITTQPNIRYNQHYCCNDPNTAGIIFLLRELNERPEIDFILITTDARTGYQTELETIISYRVNGHYLCNNLDNSNDNRLIYYYHSSFMKLLPKRLRNFSVKHYISSKKKEYEQKRTEY